MVDWVEEEEKEDGGEDGGEVAAGVASELVARDGEDAAVDNWGDMGAVSEEAEDEMCRGADSSGREENGDRILRPAAAAAAAAL